jgi:hypothetical protein
MQFIKGQNLPLTLQLIKSDNTYDEDATVTYDIYSSDLTTRPVSAQSAVWNDDFNCYHDELDVSALWADQTSGNYILKWNISDTDLFADNIIEDLCILTDASNNLDNIADAVWDEIAADHDIPLSTGNLLSTIYSSSIVEGNTTSETTSGALVRTVNFGSDKTDLLTIGYTLYNADGSEYRARTTNGVYSLGTSAGVYGANITFVDDWHGSILWDTGDIINVGWATEDFNGNSFKYITDINTDVEKILGLVHSNIYMDNPSYDSDDNLSSLRIRIYSSAASVGTTNDVISTYNVTSVGDGSGKFTSWKQVEI